MTPRRWLAAAVAAWAAVQALLPASPEPFFNNDETRHVMTGVFMRDALADRAWNSPRAYAEEYYLKAPALGLLVWPPGFYLAEGAAMACFGTSYRTGLALVWLSGALAAWGIWRLARTHGAAAPAAWAAAFALAFPKSFEYAHYVMLEMPCWAGVAWAIAQWERYLRDGRRRDALLAGVAAGAALWTRYDAVLLAPYVLFRAPWGGAWRPTMQLRGLVGLALAAALAGPLYWITWQQYGGAIANAAAVGTAGDSAPFSFARNVPYYFRRLPDMLGWTGLAFGLLGAGLAAARREGPAWAWALLAATYCTFMPLAELDARHAIYWLPAWAWFAVRGAAALAAFRPGAKNLVLAAALAAAVAESLCRPRWHVAGYAEAATAVVAARDDRPACLFDGELAGGFVLQIRLHDPARRWTTLRGDKLLYAVRSDPAGGQRSFAATAADVLKTLYDFDPTFVVVEQPQLVHVTPGGTLLRQTLAAHPERFRREREIALRSNNPLYAEGKLEIYRNLQRNPHPKSVRELPSPLLGRNIGAGK